MTTQQTHPIPEFYGLILFRYERVGEEGRARQHQEHAHRVLPPEGWPLKRKYHVKIT